MNTKNMIAAVALFAAAGSALAEQTYPYVDFTGYKAAGSRAETMAELQPVRTGGAGAGSREAVAPDAGFVSTRTRAQVIAELKQSQADGSYAMAQQEYDGQFPGADSRVQASRLAGNVSAARLN
ncbi:MAG TPA: DUF4148 domain-containing protein [Noviherbaspirillum sp.]|uniref:DUF4148 domain-containing protein n=1 Tax=Noviherbaspirillum sp. TaxID=1926288 RepID=UPI002F93FBE7